MPNVRTFVSYVRDQQGNGIGDALVQAYAITNLSTNQKSANALAETYPDVNSGRWQLNVDLDLSSTGYVSFRISRGNTVRWIEGDTVMQLMSLVGESGNIPLPPNSISDAHIGSRTVDQTTVPTGNSGTLTGLLSRLANRIRAITGETNWWTAPVTTLRELNDRFLGTASGHKHTGATGQGPRLNPADSLTWLPATADHNHNLLYRTQQWISDNIFTKTQSDNRYELKGQASGGHVNHADTAGYANTAGSATSATTATNALQLRGDDGRRFLRLLNQNVPNMSTLGGPHTIQIGTDVVTTNSNGVGHVTYPSAFPNRTVWVSAVNGDVNAYRGAIGPTGSTRTGFEVRLQGNEARQVRVNWLVIGN